MKTAIKTLLICLIAAFSVCIGPGYCAGGGGDSGAPWGWGGTHGEAPWGWGSFRGGIFGERLGGEHRENHSGRHDRDHRGYYRGHRYYGLGIAATPGFIEYVPSPVYYVPAPVYYDPAPFYYEPAPVSGPKPVSDVPAPVVNAPVPAAPAPVTVATTDNVPKGHWEVQKIWVPDNKSSWIEKYYDEARDVLVLSNREQKIGTNGHWAEREIWVEDK